MTKTQLQEQQRHLVLQRAAHKDQVTQIEEQLGRVAFALQVLEANEPSTDGDSND